MSRAGNRPLSKHEQCSQVSALPADSALGVLLHSLLLHMEDQLLFLQDVFM